MAWAVSLVEYIAALKQVIPLQHKIDLLEEDIISQKGIINAISSDIKELKEELLISEKTFLRRETDRDRLTASLVEHKQTYFNCNNVKDKSINKSGNALPAKCSYYLLHRNK